MAWIPVLIVGGILVLVGIGAVIQALRNSEGVIVGPTVPPAVNCADFCRDLLLARTRRCNAEARQRDLDAEDSRLFALSVEAFAVWGALTAAALVAASIPFVGGWIAAGLSAAAATALTLAWVLQGMALAATIQASGHRSVLQQARDGEAAALAQMMMNCSSAEQASCLARLMPCP